jgi:hypothetical protein
MSPPCDTLVISAPALARASGATAGAVAAVLGG